MALRVYNTLSRKLEDFKPLKKGHVGIYLCGLTVYDLMHIGHAKTYMAFDVILRYLKYRGYDVKYVQNVTDIDDKIIKRAGERGLDAFELSREYAAKSLEDQRTLGLLKADQYPKVSDNIPEIINAVQVLIDNGNAYVVDGNVFFDVSSFPDYGQLSRQDTKQLNRHRIEPHPGKKTPLDFSLWKKSDKTELGFESPWGYGRPGWHIECSVMSSKYLGSRFDMHGGALDLIFPHHENEIAQSESLTGKKPFVKYWLHTGFLHSSGEKMSKSLGNILPVRDFIRKHDADVLRLFVLQTHYRSPIDYSEDNILNVEGAMERLKNFRREIDASLSKSKSGGSDLAKDFSLELKKEFINSMDDDFNTPEALAAVFDAVRKINPLLNEGKQSKQSLQHSMEIFDELMNVLGLDVTVREVKLGVEEKKLIDQRNKHRSGKNWAEADRIRDLLLKRGIKLLDRPDGTTLVERSS